MKRLALAIALAGIMLSMNGCAVYVPPYDGVGISYNYAPYSGYSLGIYGNYGFSPRFYGGGWRGGWRGRGWDGHGWGGHGWRGPGWGGWGGHGGRGHRWH
jgi:hypothetical protein